MLAAPRARRDVAQPSASASRTWQVGQWALYRTRRRGQVGYERRAVVGHDACGHWVETVKQTGRDRFAGKFCARQEGGPDTMQFMVIQVNEEPPQAFDFRDGKNARFLQQVKAMGTSLGNARWGEATATREDLRVDAGMFRGAWRVGSTFALRGGSLDVTAWAHSAVPFDGLVRWVATNGDESVLIGYGDDGGPSVLPRVNPR